MRDERFRLAGWLLFVVSSLFFIVAGLRSGDVVTLLGGFFFFLACVAFLIPFIRRR